MFSRERTDASRNRPPQGWNELLPHLAAVRASELLVVSDMTGTLITQTADSMLPQIREAQLKLFQRGMTLILATADSGHSVQEFYLKPLGQDTGQSLYVVHSVGAWRGQVRNGQLIESSQGAVLSVDDRRALLAGMDRALTAVLNNSGPFFSQEEMERLIVEGTRAGLSLKSARFGPQSFIEIIPSKAAIFFLEQKRAGCLEQRIFDTYLADQDVQRVIQNGYRMIRGGNYVDVFTCSKEEGVRALMGSMQLPAKKTLMILGDSENDIGILSDNYQDFGEVLRVFVGDSQTVVESMKSGPFYQEFFQLRGSHCQGSADVFKAIER